MNEATQVETGRGIVEAIDQAGARGDLAAALEHLTAATEFFLAPENQAKATLDPDNEANAATLLAVRRITSHLAEAINDVPPAFWAIILTKRQVNQVAKLLATVHRRNN